MPRSRSLLACRLLAAVTGLAATVALPLPASSAAPPPARPAGAAATRSLTLITGDRLSIRTGTDGLLQVTTDPQPGRPAPELIITRQRGHVSTVPVQALPLINAGRLDPALFDVTTLVAQGLTDDRSASLPVLVGSLPKLTKASVTKASAGTFWAGLTKADRPGGTRTPAAGQPAQPAAAVWLDRPDATPDRGSGELRTPVGPTLQPAGHTLTVDVLDRRGQPAQDAYTLVMDADTGEVQASTEFSPGRQVFRIEADRHWSVTALVTETGPDGVQTRSFVAAPDLEVGQDTTLTLDARTALPISYAVPDRGLVPVSNELGFTRGPASADPLQTVTVRFSDPRGGTAMYAAPVPPVSHGIFRFESGQSLGVPPLTARILGRHPVDLHPVQPLEDHRLDGRHLVTVTGVATPGSYLLLDAGDGSAGGEAVEERVQAAADAGATGVILYSRDPAARPAPRLACAVPVLALGSAEAAQLLARLAAGTPTRLALDGRWFSPLRYDLFRTLDQVPDDLAFRYRRSDLARIDEVVRTLGAADSGVTTRRPAPDYQPAPMPIDGGQHRTDWVSPGVGWAEDLNFGHILDRTSGQLYGWAAFWSQPPRSLRAGRRTAVTWLNQVIRPAVPGGGFGSRTGDFLLFPATLFSDGADRPGEARFIDRVDWRLSAAGETVATSQDPFPWSPAVAPQQQLYTLQVTASRLNVPAWLRSTSTVSTFTFPSGHLDGSAPLPILSLHAHLPLDDTNSAPVGSPLDFLVSARAPDGLNLPATGMEVATSYDGGANWLPAAVRPAGEGRFLVRVDAQDSPGEVALRIRAWAAGGVSTEQVITAAYGLR